MVRNLKSHKPPYVSVLLSVYNGEAYLKDAIESILSQSYKDFEFIIIDDGSTDKSLSILKSFKDKRINLISRENRGLVKSLNEGIALARGKYIARQDADDISHPKRLAKQINCARSTGATLVGSAFTMIDMEGRRVGQQAIAQTDDFLKQAIRVGNPFAHGSVLVQREAILIAGGYSNSVGPVEDYDLWLRLAPTAKFAAINQSLYQWRINPNGISQNQSIKQVKSAEGLQNTYNQRYPIQQNLLWLQLGSYWHLRKSHQALDRLLANQILRERQKLISLGTSRLQKLALFIAAACFQPGITRQFFGDLMSRARRKMSYLQEQGRLK